MLGTGDVGRVLGAGLIRKGHTVFLGSRENNNEKSIQWTKENGANAKHGTFADAAAFAVFAIMNYG
jgi:predicted dinucleotide-binding enzyme